MREIFATDSVRAYKEISEEEEIEALRNMYNMFFRDNPNLLFDTDVKSYLHILASNETGKYIPFLTDDNYIVLVKSINALIFI